MFLEFFRFFFCIETGNSQGISTCAALQILTANLFVYN